MKPYKNSFIIKRLLILKWFITKILTINSYDQAVKMTPFGELIGRLRRAKGLQQTQLALGVGISPCYFSSIESGKKGPPSKDVLLKLIKELKLNQNEEVKFWETVASSKKTRTIPDDVGIHEYELVNKLWETLGSLSDDQVDCIKLILKLEQRR